MRRPAHIPTFTAIALLLAAPPGILRGQGGDKAMQAQADALFDKGEYAQAYPLYSQLVSLSPQDHGLNYKFGACTLYGGDDMEKAIGYLKFAVTGPATPALAWYFLGRAYQLDYRFDEAIAAYQHYRGVADKKLLARLPADAMEQQCRNGKYLLSNLKDIEVLNKVQVDATEFFRFYDLSDIGGKIVVTPEELLTNFDRKSGDRFLTYLPTAGETLYFSSYGKDGKTGKDIYRSELLPTGGYATPVKLAGYINTAEDEDYAVMAPDGTTFYFCSKGHNSMGGYDVFKSTYDKGMDAFGAPENMDFAVNTPADELLYIVAPEGKQACFASDRDSKQGMLNVYRVGTKQTPINITVLKGTYASAFDPADRKAHIMVEDALTRERVADVRTDMNGGYLLALPRGGKYKFLVEGGPAGLTHMETVNIPPNDHPKVYKQEIELVERGGEKVVIRNYFDQPLEDDVMALALSDIKRRAKLEVTGEKAPERAVAQAGRSDEPLQAAGFDGTMTLAKAQDLAHQDANELKTLAEEQDRQANAAYDMALKNVTTAEEASQRARDLVQRSEGAANEQEKDTFMRQAAEAKQLSQEANERARAAYSTARDLEASGKTSRRDAATAEGLASAIALAQTSEARGKATEALKQLKARIDAKNSPEGQLDEAERTRRAATAAEKESSKKMRQATAQREEENVLTERINRMQREADQAKGRKKDDINGQIATLEAQRAALRDEADAAFAKAREAEDGAALARAQAQLVRYLKGDRNTWMEQSLPESEIAGMEPRLSSVKAGNKALAIDERYAPVYAGTTEERERRTFDWGTHWTIADLLNGNYLAVSKSKPKARAEPGGQTDALAMTGTHDAAPRGEEARPPNATGQGQAVSGTGGTGDNAGNIAASGSKTPAGTETSKAGENPPQSASGNPAYGIPATNAQQPHVDDKASASNAPGREASMQDKAAPGSTAEHAGKGVEGSGHPGSADVAAESEQVAVAGTDTSRDVSHTTDGIGEASTGQVVQEGRPDAGHAVDRGNTASGTDRNAVPAVADGSAEAPGAQASAGDADEQAFILANKLAELEQLRQGERVRGKRDSLDQAIAAQRQLIGNYQAERPGQSANAVSDDEEGGMTLEYKLLDFDLTLMDEQLAEEAYPGFSLRREAILNGPGDGRDKANMLHALEMELVDSIDVQTARNLAVLNSHPELADQVLPRLERWRRLKEAHVDQAAAVLAQVDQEYAATETKAMEDAQLSGKAVQQTPQGDGERSTTPHNDAYVTIASDLSRIYASTLVPRSTKDGEAVAQKDKDLEQMDARMAEIDSLERVLADTPGGKDYDKLRRRIDKKIDDVLIQGVELGQRMAFISNSEVDVAKDSAKTLEKAVGRMGLPPNEPLLQMVRSYQEAADGAMGKAMAFRKDADRTGDIIQRNSLYRQAYGEELKALRDYDRSHTVRNYLLSGQAVPGEALNYEQVEARMFKPVLAGGPAGPSVQEAPDTDVARPAVEAVDTLAEKPGRLVSVVSSPEARVGAPQDATGTGAAAPVRSVPDTAGKAARPGGVALASPTIARSDSALLAQYLDTYYYLNEAERAGVTGSEDGRKYFLMKGSSMEDRANADAATTEADGAAKLAADLRAEAASGSRSNADDGAPGAQDRTHMLKTRADGLMQRSDSLHRVADRLIATAATSDAQAAILMQDMPADRSAAIMDLEQGRRRTEPLLARTRPEAGTEVPLATEAPAAVEVNNAIDTPIATERPAETASETQVAGAERTGAGAERIARVASVVGSAPEPFTGPLVNDVFQFAEVAPPREKPIPIDVPMPGGVVYKVQVGAFRNALPTEAFSDMTPVAGEHAGNGLVRYTAGMFTSADAASKAGAKVRARGYRDAFVVAYMDGKRVPLREAMRAEREVAQAATATAQGGASTLSTPRPTAATATPAAQPAAPVPTPAPATVQVPQVDAETAVLAAYPASAEAVLAEFNPSPGATDYYNDPTAAPAKQVEAVKGLFFTVQVGVYSKPTALDKLFNITPLNSELTANRKIRYTTGIFLDEARAGARRNVTVTLGVTDAFVTAYLNGKRIPVRDARALLAKFGSFVLVDPALTTQ